MISAIAPTLEAVAQNGCKLQGLSQGALDKVPTGKLDSPIAKEMTQKNGFHEMPSKEKINPLDLPIAKEIGNSKSGFPETSLHTEKQGMANDVPVNNSDVKSPLSEASSEPMKTVDDVETSKLPDYKRSSIDGESNSLNPEDEKVGNEDIAQKTDEADNKEQLSSEGYNDNGLSFNENEKESDSKTEKDNEEKQVESLNETDEKQLASNENDIENESENPEKETRALTDEERQYYKEKLGWSDKQLDK